AGALPAHEHRAQQRRYGRSGHAFRRLSYGRESGGAERCKIAFATVGLALIGERARIVKEPPSPTSSLLRRFSMGDQRKQQGDMSREQQRQPNQGGQSGRDQGSQQDRSGGSQ